MVYERKDFLQLLVLFCLILHILNKIIQKKSKFIDENGRHRIFHGVNIVYKLPPYIPTNETFHPFLSFNSDDLVYMKKFGFNLVRLGIMWESIETSPGVYDYDLLNKYEYLVNFLGKNEIYTIIDAHQDLFSRKTCGEGVPYFYVDSVNYDQICDGNLLKKFLHLIGVCQGMKEYNYREDENGLPFIEDCKKKMFSIYNTSPDITSLYDKLYSNENGLLDKYIDFWKVLANRFKGNDYVLGYDLWNEPFPGGLYDNIFENLRPGNSDDKQLLPFYRKIDQSLREIDDDYILMFEPNPFPDTLPILNWRFRGTFSEVPLNNTDKQMFNYHSYCCLASISMCKDGEPPLNQANICKDLHIENVRKANEYTSKHGIGSIITEFGACFNSESCFNEISSLADAADNFMTSWAYWMYKPFNDFTTTCTDDKEGMFEADGTIQEYKIKALTRTYVQAFQGEGVFMKFDTKTKLFEARFILDKQISHPTVIYINKEIHYKEGYRILTSKKSQINDSDKNLIKILIIDDEIIDKEEITILIKNDKEFSISESNSIEFLN